MSEEKTISEVYTDRNALAVAFAEAVRLLSTSRPGTFRSGWHPPTDADDADADEWAVLWARTPEGQVSWHVPRYLAEASSLPMVHEIWDGHTRDLKNSRLRRFASAL